MYSYKKHNIIYSNFLIDTNSYEHNGVLLLSSTPEQMFMGEIDSNNIAAGMFSYTDILLNTELYKQAYNINVQLGDAMLCHTFWYFHWYFPHL